MTLDEVSTLLDSKLEPIAREIGEVKRHLFGNGGPGLRERLHIIETECRRRGSETEKRREHKWVLWLAFIGWGVTLFQLAVAYVGK